MWLDLRLLFGILAVLFATTLTEDAETARQQRERKVVALNSEAETGTTEKATKTTIADLSISHDDIEQYDDEASPAPPPPLTPGDEYMPEKPSPHSDEHLEATYLQALKFLERGRGHGIEGRKAAYRLLDQAAQAGHTDAMKLMGFAHLFGDRARWSIDEAKKIFEELAENGSPDAQLGLAFMHATGLGVSKSNQAKALVYYMFSALGGNPLAQMAMGYRYYAGIAVPQNCENALSYYEKAAQKVADGFKFSTGLAIQRIRLTDEMEPSSTNAVTTPMDQNLIEYYRFLAEKGDVSAQVGLGQLYLTGGRGVEQNFELANKYFSSAAEAGHAGAFAFLGKMYLDGTHVTPQDNTTAFNFFLRSADKGNQNGQAGLGVMYMHGRGVRRDYEKAYRLFSLAAEQGWVDAQLYLGEMFFKGLGVKRDFKTALKYYQMATQNGHVLASYNLARMHSSGIGVLRSCTTAVEFYKNVAERGRWSEKLMEAYGAYKEGRRDEAAIKYLFLAELGYEPAQTNIAYILDRGSIFLVSSLYDCCIVILDNGEADSLFPASKENVLERAIVQWQRAANQEYPLARIKLGDYHYYGWGTPADYEQAAQHYKLAVERHATAQAMFNLGLMHEQGLGITRDLHLAKRFYDMAAEQSSDAAVPVALALAKLAVLFLLERINKNPVVQLLEQYLGPNWDVVAMTIFAGVPLILFVRWRRGHHMI
ncbi:Sel1 repeat protein [Ancylostoma caninum]|uniref:Sel1 repeat protein n=1 Tax=Ancylostoma caninum TaxID=29170 RepID=A0A368H5J3_ANCCA|nr:Sel1 repeat protein [Ancylostoma caninum]